jgi:hypothetical protein
LTGLPGFSGLRREDSREIFPFFNSVDSVNLVHTIIFLSY